MLTSYTGWLEFVQLNEGENQEVYVEFNPRFERSGWNQRNASLSAWLRSRQERQVFIEVIGKSDHVLRRSLLSDPHLVVRTSCGAFIRH